MSLISLFFLPFLTCCPGVILPFLTLFEATSNARFSPLTVTVALTLLGGADNASVALSIFPPSTL